MYRGIIQIISATDWYVEYKTEEGIILEPLACWALYEENGGTKVCGLGANGDNCLTFVDEEDEFNSYRYKPKDKFQDAK